jgi:lipid-A-disaccharide synthase-like uncharacterized protein
MELSSSSTLWIILGLAGQALFAARFLVQWIRSEALRRSVVPVSFWFLSLAGSLVLLIYAVHRQDPVFIVGQSAGFVIYTRNLMLIHKSRARKAAAHGPLCDAE